MTPILESVWQQLELARPAGDELVARQAHPELTNRVLAAIDSRGRHHILVALRDEDELYRDKTSRGLTVETLELTLPDQANSRYIKLRCEDAGGLAMFDLIGSELATQLSATTDSPARVVSKVLARWRRFWGQLPSNILSHEQQVGLFSELWFFAYWLVPAIGAQEATLRWRGPLGSRHDFESQGVSVESKGSSSTRVRVFSVGSIYQLEPPEEGRLFLFAMRIREEAGASNTLPMLVRICRELASSHGQAEDALETALLAAGYSSIHEEEYEKVHWRVIEDVLFNVREDFPRLTSSSFANGVPAGVEEISYEINLSAFDHLIVARAPSDAAHLLQTANRSE